MITVGDMAALQRRLLDHLGIRRLRAIVGGSLGGHQALAWGAMWPERTESVVAVATSARLTSQAIAFDVVGRNAILRDPGFADGRYHGTGDSPTVGIALARMLGHITYLSRESMSEKFEANRLEPREVASEFEKRFAVGAYLAHQGQQFVERFDANSYLTLSMAMDRLRALAGEFPGLPEGNLAYFHYGLALELYGAVDLAREVFVDLWRSLQWNDDSIRRDIDTPADYERS